MTWAEDGSEMLNVWAPSGRSPELIEVAKEVANLLQCRFTEEALEPPNNALQLTRQPEQAAERTPLVSLILRVSRTLLEAGN